MSIHPEQHPLDGKLEPETKDCFNDRAPLYSIAISLKRIADAPSEAAARITELEGEVQAGIREILALRADAERASPAEPSGWRRPSEGDVLQWLRRSYVSHADERQKAMGLSYTTAETEDLARGIARFVATWAPPTSEGGGA